MVGRGLTPIRSYESVGKRNGRLSRTELLKTPKISQFDRSREAEK
jgi:hypothetical protein